MNCGGVTYAGFCEPKTQIASGETLAWRETGTLQTAVKNLMKGWVKPTSGYSEVVPESRKK
jgi:hypothetical protein